MKNHAVRVKKNLILVDISFLADFFGRNKNTVRGWKNSKNMPVHETDDRGVNYFDLLEAYKWYKINISEKFNKNKDKNIDAEVEDDFVFELPYGLEIAEIDLDNSLHLAILAAHPMGELIRDTLEFRAKQFEKEKDIEKKSFELKVRKREFLKTEELNQILAETVAMIKDVDINSRAKFPIEIAEALLNAGVIKREDKANTQGLIAEAFDEVQNEKYKLIDQQFMKHIQGYTPKIAKKFLYGIYKMIKGEEDEQK